MNTLILNNLTNNAFELLNYNRNTSFDINDNNRMNSVAYFDIVSDANVMDILQEIGLGGITSIVIKHDDDTIYSLEDISASITTINESLVTDHININVSITF